MKINKKELLAIVHEKILQDENFNEALEITKKNSSGKIWLIGGFLYRNIVNELYGTCKKVAKDFDLVVERANERIILPEGWKKRTNHFGNPELSNSRYEIDFIPLDNIYYIKKNKLKPSIENHLKGSVFNVQYIAYDIFNKKIIGNIGIKAIEDRTVGVYNLEMLKYISKMHHKTANDMIREKADALGFRAELI